MLRSIRSTGSNAFDIPPKRVIHFRQFGRGLTYFKAYWGQQQNLTNSITMPVNKEKKLFKIVGGLYSNPDCNDALTSALEDTVKLLNGSSAALTYLPKDAAHHEVPLSYGLDDAFMRDYVEKYGDISPFREKINSLAEGRTFARVNHLDDQTFEKTDIYQDFFKEYDIFNYEYHALMRSDGLMAGFSVTLPKRKRVFSKSDREALDALLPHLKRALSLRLLGLTKPNDHDDLFEAVNTMARAVLVVDQNGHVMTANARAAKIVGANDGLSVDKLGCLTAASQEGTKRLRAILDGSHSPKRNGNFAFGGVCLLKRPSGRRPLQLLASPLSEKPGFGRDRLTLVFLSDPDEPVNVRESILRELFELTPAEASVASRLATGESVEQICEALKITANTCRTHLKRIYAKTETSRQGELVNLILTSVASLPDPY